MNNREYVILTLTGWADRDVETGGGAHGRVAKPASPAEVSLPKTWGSLFGSGVLGMGFGGSRVLVFGVLGFCGLQQTSIAFYEA